MTRLGPVIAIIAGKRQLVVQTRTRLCGVDLGDGSLLWSNAIEAYRNMNILTPTDRQKLANDSWAYLGVHLSALSLFCFHNSNAS